MASSAEFEAAEPDFASRVQALPTARKHLTKASLHRDGSPPNRALTRKVPLSCVL